MTDILKINAIKTDNGYYISHAADSHWSHASSLSVYEFDGKKAEKTHNTLWLYISRLPKTITREVAQANINLRFELIDPSFANEKVPFAITRDEAGIFDAEEREFVWNEKYAHLKSLYKIVSDPQPNKIEEISFEAKVILEIDQIKKYGGFSYPVQKTQWSHEGFIKVTDKDIFHNLVDTIIFPGIILPARESKLTSEQSYKIVRKHVQDNINPKYASITSDYNFCFTVTKKIQLAKPIKYQKDVSRYGARKAKYETAFQNTRSIEVFKMGHLGDSGPYKGYEAIKGFEGANVEELKQNIDEFLADLMEKINKPLTDCPHCNGMGVICEAENKP